MRKRSGQPGSELHLCLAVVAAQAEAGPAGEVAVLNLVCRNVSSLLHSPSPVQLRGPWGLPLRGWLAAPAEP